MRSFQFIIFLSNLLLFGFNALAQNSTPIVSHARTISQYNIEIWNANNGLPTNGALHIIQSKDGYLWLGTFNGLVKFDGVDVTIYDRNNIPELTNNVFEHLLQEDDSTFWFCTQGGVVKKSNTNWKIFTTKNGLPSNITSFALLDSKKKLWIATSNGLAYLKDENTFSTEGIPTILTKNQIRAIAEDKAGNLWFAVGKIGVVCLQPNGQTILYNDTKLSSNIISHLCPVKNGNIWVSTEAGVNIIKPDGSVGRISSNIGLPSNFIDYCYEDRNGEIWVGTERGLAKILPGRVSTLSKSEDIDIHNVTSVMQDFEGHIWVTTYRHGFYRLKTGRFNTYSMEEGLSDDMVYGVYENLEDSTLLIASEKGIDVFNLKEEVIGREFSKFHLNEKLPSQIVRDLLKDSKGNWWICTREGLVRSNHKEFEIFTAEKGLPSNFIRNVCEAKDGSIWVGTVEGLAIYKNDKFEIITKNEGLSNNFILNIFQDSKDNIWISTREGVNKIKDGKVIEVYSLKNGLAGDVTFKMHEDKQGLLWVGANGGLNVILPNGSVRNFANKLGHWGQTVFEVIEDNVGTFWITCNEGVFTVKKSDLLDYMEGKIQDIPSRLYNKEDGLKVSEATPNSRVCKASDGKLWIPTIRGVAVLNPYETDVSNFPPPIAFDFIKVDYEDVPLNGDIIIPAGNQRIEIKFTGLSYKAPYNIQFKHQLENFDKDWIVVGRRREAFYTNLPPGEYEFKVAASNTDGVWSNPKTIKIIKLPYFWQTIWFWIIAFFGVIGIILIILKWRIQSIARQNQILEKLVEERTEQVRKQSAEIEVKNKELAFQNTEIEAKKDELEESYESIKLLSEIGQEVTSSLTLESIVKKVYSNLSQLITIDIFGIGVVNEEMERIEFTGYDPLTHKLHKGNDALSDDSKLSVWCFNNEDIVFIRNIENEYQWYLKKMTSSEKITNAKSVIFVPMIVKDTCLGVLSIHAKEENAYTENDLNIVKSLAVYVAIAIDNANVYEQLNLKNQKMLESINYAQRIQNTLLPSDQKIKSLLPESFVLFRPRDIVSGDVYWVEEIVDIHGVSKIVVAVVDCTGHGVPGAIMSMIAFEQLSEIVLLYRNDNPAEILDYLNFGVRTILKQEETGMQDGMDMAICVINKEAGYVDYAGAKNPLVYIQNGELKEIKADRMPIGGFWKNESAKFTKHRINILPNTSIYMFSDGFQDQFGGINNKKFSQRQLKELLYSLNTLTTQMQCELLHQALKDWMSEGEEYSQEQLDDVLVMGIKL
jgi:ligand-binding sensor domain-containing protein/serine phosphatase RsbU (regulator of sigma subunit)